MLKNVLCIDDDQIVHLYTQAILKQSGISENIDFVNNGQEGLDYLEKCLSKKDLKTNSYPDLILLDINMPIMDGWTFLDQYSLKYAHVFNKKNIVVVSSSISPHDIAKSESYPSVLYFISKPLTAKMIKNIKDLIA